MVPDSLRGRLRWAVSESLVIAGVLLVWVVVAVVLNVLLGLVVALVDGLGLAGLRPVYEFATSPAVGWASILPLAFLTAGLYVLVRAGTVLLEHYRAGGGRASPST